MPRRLVPACDANPHFRLGRFLGVFVALTVIVTFIDFEPLLDEETEREDGAGYL